MDWDEIEQQISIDLNQHFNIKNTIALAGGDIHKAFLLKTNLGNYFLKTNLASKNALFATEAHSLKSLHHSLKVKVPMIFHQGKTTKTSWLLLEYLSLTPQGNDFQRGKNLALMHQYINQQPSPFGWFEDNYIGLTLQKNTWSSNWVNFFSENRLGYQLSLAKQAGGSANLIKSGQQLIEKLPSFFTHYSPKASLLHGDLWPGNSQFLSSGEAIFFDPASYYGDRETDLAMTELFGGFSAEFYKGYQQTFPLDAGYKNRKTLYNLYHILNHYILFGGNYAQQAQVMIQKLLNLNPVI